MYQWFWLFLNSDLDLRRLLGISNLHLISSFLFIFSCYLYVRLLPSCVIEPIQTHNFHCYKLVSILTYSSVKWPRIVYVYFHTWRYLVRWIVQYLHILGFGIGKNISFTMQYALLMLYGVICFFLCVFVLSFWINC